ncbi:hypothetical protein JHK82_039771 [Glycine max]|nr:hypothetical protein JHK86_039965 [Glycine max]KAG4965568.1 hypothetical protein JHK85_040543 [Glycine max]KAG5110548.1 hypothetical protein JHK82_039771 [Glycine max]KAG5121836.1 hypothetical protein JHK84_040176 [Glycine max]
MAAVDASKERDEANLANLAMKKVQKVKLSELVDPSFGFESDQVVKRILTSVAGLAFRCVQGDNELSPSMDEVLEALNKFQNENYEFENLEKKDDLLVVQEEQDQELELVDVIFKYEKKELEGSSYTPAGDLDNNNVKTDVVDDDRVELEKSNILLMGPTRSDATSLTHASL